MQKGPASASSLHTAFFYESSAKPVRPIELAATLEPIHTNGCS